MTKRTDEDRARILERCLEIEAEGGDVLAYLATEHYVTPRATWINMQKEMLGRTAQTLTDGKPTGVRREKAKAPKQEDGPVLLDEDPYGKRHRRQEFQAEAVALLKEGRREECVKLLEENGITNTHAYIHWLRKKNGMCTPRSRKKEQEAPAPAPIGVTEVQPVEPPPAQDPEYRFIPMRKIREDIRKEMDYLNTVLSEEKDPMKRLAIIDTMGIRLKDMEAVERVSMIGQAKLAEVRMDA